MPWPNWEQSSAAALLSGLIWLALRRLRPGRFTFAEALTAEFALISGLYALWRLARMLPIASADGAIDRARWINSFQQAIHLPTELSLQRFVLDHDTVATVCTWYYATVHVPALLAFLVWLFVRHRDQYPHWRNGLALITLWCLVIRFMRVAPPRFLPDLGYVDLSYNYGPSVYSGDVTTGISDQFAAMPSIHVAWAAVVSFGIVAASTSRWRWLALLHVVMTMIVVSATGNHWWLDGIVAILLLAASLRLDTVVRRRRAAAREDRAAIAADASGTGDPATRTEQLTGSAPPHD